MNDILAIIPARKGSKGIPNKNHKRLNKKPLINYTIKEALKCFKPKNICLTTNDETVINIAESQGLKVPFIRPENISEDTTAMVDVLFHALDFYFNQGIEYKTLVLLQPTSPFRTATHILEALELYQKENVDMVVSVKEAKSNPYYNLFEEDNNEFLQKSKEGNFTRRQDIPNVYELNGAIYIIDIKALREIKDISLLKKKRKYVMDEISSFDLDSILDWKIAEHLIKKNNE